MAATMSSPREGQLATSVFEGTAEIIGGIAGMLLAIPEPALVGVTPSVLVLVGLLAVASSPMLSGGAVSGRLVGSVYGF